MEWTWDTFLWAAGGGLAAEALRWWRLVRAHQEGSAVPLPAYARSPFYWGLTAVIVLAGGMLAAAYVASGQQLGPILAVNVGASAPLIVQGLASSAPALSGAKAGDGRRGAGGASAPRPSVRDFLRGR